MAQYLMQMRRVPRSNLPRDAVVTTFHLDTDLDFIGVPGGEPGDLVGDAAVLFRTSVPAIDVFNGWEARCYVHGQPKGTPPAKVVWSQDVAAGSATGPREVALCLSYYADLNQPRRRGRMYLGPWPTNRMLDRPHPDVMTYLQTLANGISGLGGVNVQWVQYSPTTGEFHTVTDWFVDNEWDTQRSRGIRADARIKGKVSG